jgi:hypothetical protein
MINKKTLLILTVTFILASCKKNYQCQCTNSYGTYDAGEIEDTKRKAKKHCQSLSTSTTTCDIK